MMYHVVSKKRNISIKLGHLWNGAIEIVAKAIQIVVFWLIPVIFIYTLYHTLRFSIEHILAGCLLLHTLIYASINISN